MFGLIEMRRRIVVSREESNKPPRSLSKFLTEFRNIFYRRKPNTHLALVRIVIKLLS